MTTDPTRNERQRRFQNAKRLGLEYVSGYLPPKRAEKVRAWLAEAEIASTPARPRGRPKKETTRRSS